jgi:hypothetical protein
VRWGGHRYILGEFNFDDFVVGRAEGEMVFPEEFEVELLIVVQQGVLNFLCEVAVELIRKLIGIELFHAVLQHRLLADHALGFLTPVLQGVFVPPRIGLGSLELRGREVPKCYLEIVVVHPLGAVQLAFGL